MMWSLSSISTSSRSDRMTAAKWRISVENKGKKRVDIM